MSVVEEQPAPPYRRECLVHGHGDSRVRGSVCACGRATLKVEMTCETPDAQPAALSPEGWGGLSSEELARADFLSRHLTAFPTLYALTTAPNYRPSLYGADSQAKTELANFYDRAQAHRGITGPRAVAFRGY